MMVIFTIFFGAIGNVYVCVLDFGQNAIVGSGASTSVLYTCIEQMKNDAHREHLSSFWKIENISLYSIPSFLSSLVSVFAHAFLSFLYLSLNSTHVFCHALFLPFPNLSIHCLILKSFSALRDNKTLIAITALSRPLAHLAQTS